MRRCRALALVFAGACVPTGIVDLPPLPSGTKSVLFIAGGEVFAIDAGGSTTASLGGDTSLYALMYPYTLDELHLAPGLVPLAAKESDPSRPFPLPAHVFAKTLDASAWAPIELPDDLAALRLAGAIDDCFDAGGCVVAEKCVMPCPPAPTIIPPALPEAAELPHLVCPTGFMPRTTEAGATTCDPPPLAETCPAGEAQRFGESSCTPIGHPCPPGQFADSLPPGAIYVRPGASGGDGTEALPFATIAEALIAVPEDGTIALSSGVHGEDLEIGKSVTIAGACSALTVLTGRIVAESNVALRDLTIQRIAPATGNALQLDAPITSLDGVVVDNTDTAVVVRAGGRLTIRDALLSSTAERALNVNASSVTIDRTAIIGGDLDGIYADGRSTLTITALLVRGAGPLPDGNGCAVRIEDGSFATFRGAHLAHNHRGGICAFESSNVRAREVFIHETVPGNGGIIADRASTIFVSDSAFESNFDQHAFASFDSLLVFTNVIMGPILSEEAGNAEAIDLRESEGLLDHVAIENLAGTAVGVYTSSVTASHVTISGPPEDVVLAHAGAALQLFEGSSGTVDHVSVRRFRTCGMNVANGSNATVRDLAIEDILFPDPAQAIDAKGADALIAQNQSLLTVDRVSIARVRSTSIVIEDADTVATLRDVTITGGVRGGVELSRGSFVTIERLAVESGGANGILFASPLVPQRTEVHLSHATITGDHRYGITSTGEGNIEVSRFLVRGPAELGLRITGGHNLRFANGRVETTPTGASFVLAGDPNVVLEDVAFRDVDTSVALDRE